MTDPTTLLRRHRPLLRYDKQEVYFADSAAIWTDGPQQRLQSGDGTLLAAARPADGKPRLSLAYLRPDHYENGAAVTDEDRVGCATKDYAQQARHLHLNPEFRNRMYGRLAVDCEGRTWLQYWFFYFYNDYNLIGPFLPAGLHEGDWEMVQLRLDAAGTHPELAVYAAHKEAGSRPWAKVERVGARPVVYVARGSHAAYFSRGAHWTGVWFDHADGAGFSPDVKLVTVADSDDAFDWLRWTGYWGDTRPSGGKADAFSPTGPARHKQWDDPLLLLGTAEAHAKQLAAERPPAPAVPAAPDLLSLARDGDALRIDYSSAGWPAGSDPAQLVVTLNSPEDLLPPTPIRVLISSPSGTVELPGALRDDWSYDAAISVVDAQGLASASTRGKLPVR